VLSKLNLDLLQAHFKTAIATATPKLLKELANRYFKQL
jgi:hypothetical protein